MSVTQELSRFCAELRASSLPKDVLDRTHLLVVDLLGNIVRGRVEGPATASLFSAVDDLGLGQGEARIFGTARTCSAAGAAFLNGAFAHALDFDDTHAPGTLHPGAPVIPAAIAAAELVGASGSDVIAAIVAGYETACRIAVALPAGDHYARGFHPSATCGAFGAAAAAGRVFGLNEHGIASAMGIALSQCAGSLEFLVNGAWTKPFQVGWAAMSGLAAATLARHDFRGAAEAIEGRHGFLQGYAPNPIPQRVVADLGTVFELMATGVKPYPSCRYGHAGIDAVLALRAEYGYRPEEIENITYGLSKAGLTLIGWPEAKRQDPHNIVDAQFSAPFVLSTAMATGKVEWDSYRLLNDPVIRGLLSKVRSVHDPEIETEYPANMSGKITITARGETHVRKVIVPLGEPSNFLSEQAILAKFNGLAEPVLGGKAAQLSAAALKLRSLAAIGELTRYAS